MPGSFDFIHLKRHTKGSSNEISFDVLDAARNELDSKSTKGSKAPKPVGNWRGSYHGVAGTSTLSAVPEVERRKQTRHRRAVRFRVGVVMLVLAALTAVGFLVYNFQQGRVDFSIRIDALVSSVETIDEDLATIDKLMIDPFSEEEQSERASVIGKSASLEKKLDEVLVGIDEARPYCAGEEDETALNQLSSTVEDRKKMLEAAVAVFKLSEEHQLQLKEAGYAWTEVVKADQQAREATAAANRATTDVSTTSARQLTQEAFDIFANAKAMLETVQARRSGLSFAEEITYIDKRLEALSYALATSDALLEGDREAATSNNDAYNKADQEAALMAADLPLMLDDIVDNAYVEEKESIVEKYGLYRGSVVDADASIRAYLKR